MPELKNNRWEKFAQCCAKGMTQEKAYLEAGYKPKTKKPETIRGLAAQVRSHTIVAERIAELKKLAADETIIEIRDVLLGLKRIALADLAHAVDDENGKLKAIHDIPWELRVALAGLETKEEFDYEDGRKIHTGYIHKIKLPDKNKAWESLGRYLKMFTDKVEHGISDDLASRLKDARERRDNGGGA